MELELLDDFLKERHRKEPVFLVLRYQLRTAWHDHIGQLLVHRIPFVETRSAINTKAKSRGPARDRGAFKPLRMRMNAVPRHDDEQSGEVFAV